MIKTHKPRGHFWSCLSVFQQSKEIRNIRWEDCTPPREKVLFRDADEESLSAGERAVKRRKIEKLADDFLNGVPLVVKSARPHPTALKGTVEGNERSRAGAKYSLPKLDLPEDDGELWADVESPAEMLARLTKESKVKKAKKQTDLPARKDARSQDLVTVTEETASSACKQARRQKAVKVSMDPSTGAMKQAAALRDRRLHRAASELARVTEIRASDTINDSDHAESHSESGSMARVRYFRNRKPEGTEWLLRRNTKLYELSPDESFDELSRSKDTPSKSTQPPAPMPETSPAEMPKQSDSRKAQPAVPLSFADPLSASFERPKHIAIPAYQEDWSCYDKSPSQVGPSGDVQPASYHTASEDTDAGAHGPADSQADSQTWLLRQHGISGASRPSWASTNDPGASIQPGDEEASGHEESVESTEKALRASLQESAQQAGKAKKGKRTMSASTKTPQDSGNVPRQRSAPAESESQQAVEQMESLPLDERRLRSAFQAYNTTQAPNTDSPFMFRKGRASKESDASEQRTGKSTFNKSSRRRVTFPSSENGAVAAEAPVIDLSLGNNDSFGAKLNLALTDEHLNAVMPIEPPSTGRKSSLRRSIRDELREAGAEISLVEGEPASSQLEGLAQARNLALEVARGSGDSNANGSARMSDEPEKPAQQTQLPSTQVLMAQATRDFFDSPEKQADGLSTIADVSIDGGASASELQDRDAREPLRELSQGQQIPPSTQAMMIEWSPWSTVKKPRSRGSRTAEPSPTAAGRSLRKKDTTSFHQLEDPNTAKNGSTPRRSSLRFSTTLSDTSGKQSSLAFPVTKSQFSQDNVSCSGIDTTGMPKSILRKTRTSQGAVVISDPSPVAWERHAVIANENDVLDHSTSVSTRPGASSLQCAQRVLLKETSNLDEAINDLTTSVLCNEDLDGVLSQLGG